MVDGTLEDRLENLSRQLKLLPEAEEPPLTTLEVLGRSRTERDWQRLFFYFLESENPHRMGNELLEHLLSALSERNDIDFSYSRFDLEKVQIEQEVITAAGRPDGVTWVEDTWFVCWELKVGTPEGADQTRRYATVEDFDEIDLEKADVPERGHHYIYLAPADASPPQAAEFVHVSWEWVGDQLEAFLAGRYGTYPVRTTAQLTDLIDTIRNELTMTEYKENRKEKGKLYIDYIDEITAVKEAFDDEWDAFTATWGTRLANRIDRAQIVEVPGLEEPRVAIDLDVGGEDPQRWILRQGQSDWAGIHLDRWWRDANDHAVIFEKDPDGNDRRIFWCHRMDENQQLALTERTLELQLFHGTGNWQEFTDAMNAAIDERLEAAPERVPSAVTRTGQKAMVFTARYDIPVQDHGDFYEAYVSALATAVSDLVIENPEFVALITDAFEETLERSV